MINPSVDDVLRSVIATIEDEIAPSADEYVASLCRTAAQMLRHVAVRQREEVPALAADVADLRQVLTEAAADVPELDGAIRAAVANQPAAAYPALADLRADAIRLRRVLAQVIEQAPEESPIRISARAYIGRQLRRELPWQQDAYTGPRR